MPAIPAQWLLGHHEDNPYFAFTDACNAEGVRIILASGQACVWYRLTLASKDGDWLIHESDAACAVVLNQLATLGARYRLGAPLHPRWLQAGWSSHFEATDPSGLRLRFDFVSRPPRITSERLAQIWQESESGRPAVVQPLDLIQLKRTMRLKDYPFIGALAQVIRDPASQLACDIDAQSVLDLLDAHPDLLQQLGVHRPGLAGVPRQRDLFEAAIDAEIRASRHADEHRLAEYSNALQPWAHHFRSLDLAGLSLADAHQHLCEQALGRLPDLAPQIP